MNNEYLTLDNAPENILSPINSESIDKKAFVSDKMMVKYMFHILSDYDSCKARNIHPKVNPMQERIAIKFHDGTVVEIPENIQRDSIALYYKLKGKNTRLSKCNINRILIIVLIILVLYCAYKFIGENSENDFY